MSAPYVPLTLTKLKADAPVLPALRKAVCASCPLSMWYIDSGLACHCTVLYRETWRDGTPSEANPVIICDARADAIAKLEAAAGAA